MWISFHSSTYGHHFFPEPFIEDIVLSPRYIFIHFVQYEMVKILCIHAWEIREATHFMSLK